MPAAMPAAAPMRRPVLRGASLASSVTDNIPLAAMLAKISRMREVEPISTANLNPFPQQCRDREDGPDDEEGGVAGEDRAEDDAVGGESGGPPGHGDGDEGALIDHLADLLGVPQLSFAIGLSRFGPYAKPVLQLFDDTGTVVGSRGTILRTTDGGTTWIPQKSSTTQSLLGVSFANANTGTVVGAGGTILRTTDGGTTWMPQNSGTTQSLLGVSFADSNTGTAVGNENRGLGIGTILRTTDGGATWTAQDSGTRNGLWGVSFTDTNTGTAVGYSGTILRTTDGGATWVAQDSGATDAGRGGSCVWRRSTGFAGCVSPPAIRWISHRS